MDICAMMVTDLGLYSADDYSNVGKLLQQGIFERKITDFLKRANGLRNRLIHDYNMVSDGAVLDFVKSELEYFNNFRAGILEWLKKKR